MNNLNVSTDWWVESSLLSGKNVGTTYCNKVVKRALDDLVKDLISRPYLDLIFPDLSGRYKLPVEFSSLLLPAQPLDLTVQTDERMKIKNPNDLNDTTTFDVPTVVDGVSSSLRQMHQLLESQEKHLTAYAIGDLESASTCRWDDDLGKAVCEHATLRQIFVFHLLILLWNSKLNVQPTRASFQVGVGRAGLEQAAHHSSTPDLVWVDREQICERFKQMIDRVKRFEIEKGKSDELRKKAFQALECLNELLGLIPIQEVMQQDLNKKDYPAFNKRVAKTIQDTFYDGFHHRLESMLIQQIRSIHKSKESNSLPVFDLDLLIELLCIGISGEVIQKFFEDASRTTTNNDLDQLFKNFFLRVEFRALDQRLLGVRHKLYYIHGTTLREIGDVNHVDRLEESVARVSGKMEGLLAKAFLGTSTGTKNPVEAFLEYQKAIYHKFEIWIEKATQGEKSLESFRNLEVNRQMNTTEFDTQVQNWIESCDVLDLPALSSELFKKTKMATVKKALDALKTKQNIDAKDVQEILQTILSEKFRIDDKLARLTFFKTILKTYQCAYTWNPDFDSIKPESLIGARPFLFATRIDPIFYQRRKLEDLEFQDNRLALHRESDCLIRCSTLIDQIKIRLTSEGLNPWQILDLHDDIAHIADSLLTVQGTDDTALRCREIRNHLMAYCHLVSQNAEAWIWGLDYMDQISRAVSDYVLRINSLLEKIDNDPELWQHCVATEDLLGHTSGLISCIEHFEAEAEKASDRLRQKVTESRTILHWGNELLGERYRLIHEIIEEFEKNAKDWEKIVGKVPRFVHATKSLNVPSSLETRPPWPYFSLNAYTPTQAQMRRMNEITLCPLPDVVDLQASHIQRRLNKLDKSWIDSGKNYADLV